MALFKLILIALLLLVLVVGSNAYAVELLKQNLFCKDMKRFLQDDFTIWTSFLKNQRGFVGKDYWMDPRDSRGTTSSRNCTVYQHITWQTRELWKAVNKDELNAVHEVFVQRFGYDPILTALPSGDGFDVLQ
jgi:uncharacterized protein (TIGR03792 family)